MTPATRTSAVALRDSRWFSRHLLRSNAQMPRNLASSLVLAVTLALGACGDPSARDGDITPAVINVADAALAGGMYSIAISTSNAILAKYPHDTAALATKGDALLGIGDAGAAEQAYRSLLAIDQKSVRANLGLARIKLQTDPVAAEAAFLTVLEYDPRNVAAWSDIGIARDLQGRHADAQQAYRSALGIAPDNVGARVNLGLSLALSGRPDEGVHLLQPLADLAAAPARIRDNLALARSLAGEPQRIAPEPESTRMAATASTASEAAQPATETGAPRMSVAAHVAESEPPIAVGTSQPPLSEGSAGSVAVITPSALRGMASEEMTLPSVDPAARNGSHQSLAASQLGCGRSWSHDPPDQMAVSAATVGWSNGPCVSPTPPLPVEQFATAPETTMAWPDGDETKPADDPTISEQLPRADTVGHDLSTGAAWSAMLLQSITGIPDDMLLSASIELAAPTTAADDEGRPEARQNRMTCASCAGRIPMVQVGSLDSEAAAHVLWDRLVARMPVLFAGRGRIVEQTEIGGRSFWRLRTDGFADLGEATAFCSQLTSAGAGCWTVLASP